MKPHDQAVVALKQCITELSNQLKNLRHRTDFGVKVPVSLDQILHAADDYVVVGTIRERGCFGEVLGTLLPVLNVVRPVVVVPSPAVGVGDHSHHLVSQDGYWQVDADCRSSSLTGQSRGTQFLGLRGKGLFINIFINSH